MNFDIKNTGRPSTREKNHLKKFNLPAIMPSGVSTKILSENLSELYDGKKFLLQEKPAGIISDKINEKILAKVDEFSKNKCIS